MINFDNKLVIFFAMTLWKALLLLSKKFHKISHKILHEEREKKEGRLGIIFRGLFCRRDHLAFSVSLRLY